MFTKPWSRRFKWLMGISALYATVALVVSLCGYSGWLEFIQMVWLAILATPFFCPPLNRWLHMDRKNPEDQW